VSTRWWWISRERKWHKLPIKLHWYEEGVEMGRRLGKPGVEMTEQRTEFKKNSKSSSRLNLRPN